MSMHEIGILTASDANDESLFATMYDGVNGSLVRVYGEDGGLDIEFGNSDFELQENSSIIVRTSGVLQFTSSSEVLHLSMWFERAAMWLAMMEEQQGEGEY